MSPISSIHSPWKGLLTLVFLASAHPALAIDSVCVQTGADLVSALNAAQSVPKQIKISQGAYSLNSIPYFSTQPGTSIEGGYFSGCGSRQIAVGNTILSASQEIVVDMLGDLTLEGVTLQLQQGVSFAPASGFIPGSQLLIRRDVFRLSGPYYSNGILDINYNFDDMEGSNGNAKIVDSLFVGNTATDSTCVVELKTSYGSSNFTLVNNTVYGNSGGGVCMRNFPDYASAGNGSLFAYNNIFYNNPGTDLYTDTANLELKWNTFGTFGGPAPTTEQFTQHGDPKLDASYHPIESPASPVINTGAFDGNPDLPLHDLDGGPRVVGTRVDRGVYESSIDDAYLLTVKNTNNAGTDSLRAAIASANANGGGLISFQIPGGCSPVQVIHLTSALPAIAAPVIINGYSQSGASDNTLDVGDDANICIVLDGANTIGNGFLVAANAPANTQLTVLGIGFSGFVTAAINLSGGSGHGVQGNHVGGKVGGVTLAPSGYGVYIDAGVSNVAIGGVNAANRNIIGDATIDGIRIRGPANALPAATGNTITNNYIGIGWAASAFVDHGNAQKGIHVLGSNNQITGNLVGFNGSDGIDLDGTSATGNFIESNLIGVAEFFVHPAGNAGTGVRVENSAHDNKIRSNTIQYNAGPGVRLVNGLGNTIRYNSFYSNGYPNDGAIGIDLAGLGVTANDDDGTILAMSMANRGLNFPLLTLATGTPLGVPIVKGLLTTTPGDYYIDLYANKTCDASGHGEGYGWMGSGKVTIGPSETFTAFSIEVVNSTFLNPTDWTITATATDAATNTSPGNTSEFSACKQMTNDRIFANGFDPPPV